MSVNVVITKIENVGCSSQGDRRKPGDSRVPISTGEVFDESKGGGGIAVDDAPGNVVFFGNERVRAEPCVVNFSVSGFTAIETRQAGGRGVQVNTWRWSQVDDAVVTKKTEA